MLELHLNQLDYPLLSLMIFLPVLGAFLLLFIRNAAAARWIALGVLARRDRPVPSAAPEFRQRHAEHAVRREHALDRGLEHQLQARRRRDQHPVRGADHAPHDDLHHGLLDGHPGPGQGVHDRDAVPGGGDHRRVRVPRPVPVLHLLGSHADPHVPPDRRLGRPEPAVRGDQVLSVHPRRKRAHAGRDHRRVFCRRTYLRRARDHEL